MEESAYAQRIFDDDSWRIFGRIRCALRRRLHQWALNYGTFHASTALAHCNDKFHGRRFLDGELHSAFDS